MNVVAILEMFSLNILCGTTKEAQWCPPLPQCHSAAPDLDCTGKGSTVIPALCRGRFAWWKEEGEKEKVSHISPIPCSPPDSRQNLVVWSHELAWRIMVNNYLWYTEHCLKRLKMTHNYPEALGYGGEFPWHCFTYKNGLRTIYDQQ